MGLVQTPARGKSCDVRKPASGSLTSFFLKQTIYLFFGCTGSSLPPGLFSACGEQGLFSGCSVGSSWWGLVLFPRTGSVGFGNRGTWAQ